MLRIMQSAVGIAVALSASKVLADDDDQLLAKIKKNAFVKANVETMEKTTKVKCESWNLKSKEKDTFSLNVECLDRLGGNGMNFKGIDNGKNVDISEITFYSTR